MGFRVEDSGLRVQGSGFRVKGLRLRVDQRVDALFPGFVVWCLGFKV